MTTEAGVLSLDPTPDIEQILLLSDELDLDEIECAGLVEEGRNKTGRVSAAAGAGEYYDKRMAAIHCLMTMLVTQVSGYGSIKDEIFDIVEQCNVGLLQEGDGTSTKLVKNLCASARQSIAALKDFRSSRLQYVENSLYSKRTDCMYNETIGLCECLVYACCIKQRMTSSDIATMLDLLHDLMQHDAAHGVLSMRIHASLVVVAIMLSMLPQELEDEALKADDDAMLKTILLNAELQSKLREFASLYEKSPELPFPRIVDLLYATMSLYIDRKDGEALKRVILALSQGIFGSMRTLFFEDIGHIGEIMEFNIASIVNQFIPLFVEISDGMNEDVNYILWLVHSSKQNTKEERDQTRGIITPMEEEKEPQSPDSIASLLNLWAACLDGRFSLFQRSQESVASFLRAVGTDDQLMLVSTVFIGHMKMLSAIASTEDGARLIFSSLHDKNSSHFVVWRKLFEALKHIIHVYENSVVDQRTDVQQPLSATVLHPHDSAGVCAFLDVLRQVIENSSTRDVLQWLHELEEDAGVSPCWELLFEAMCCPVPQTLKASLDRVIAALAMHQPLVGPLWDRLLGAVVVKKDPLNFDGRKSVPMKYDLTYQLNEIQARAEEYEEAIAFVELLNALWMKSGTFVDGGAKYEHFTRFVLEEIVSSIYQRSFKHEKQRWQLISKCLTHCRLCLESLPSIMDIQANQGSQIMTPGEYVLTDLLEARTLFRVVNYTLSLGTDWLSEQYEEGILAEYKAEAVVESLHLVRRAMSMDLDFISLKQINFPGRVYSPIEVVLLHDRERIPTILDYCRCSWDANLRREALLVSQHMISRIPDIVNKLESIGNQNEIRSNLQKGYSMELKRASSTPEASQQRDDDDCAQIALDIILESLKSGISSNFGEYICGFEVCSGVDYMTLQDPSYTNSPLRDVLDIVTRSSSSCSRSQMYEKCLQIIYYLCESEETSQYFVHYLMSVHAGLAPLVPHILFSPMPLQKSSKISAMYQRAWLLRIFAIEIFSSDIASVTIRENTIALIKDLFRVNGDFEMQSASNQVYSSLAGMIQLVLSTGPKERWLGDNLPTVTRKMLDLLDVESLLNPKLLEQGEGVSLVSTWRGDAVINIDALKDELLQRYTRSIENHRDLVQNLKDAGKHALEHADELNYFTEFSGGIQAIASGMQAAILATVSSKYGLIVQACNNLHVVAQYLCMAIQDCTNVMAHAFTCSYPQVTDNIGIALESMASRLREVTKSEASSNSHVFALVSTTLLAKQLDMVWSARQHQTMRMPLYNTLSIYLDMSRNSKTLAQNIKEASINILYQGMRSLQPMINDAMSSEMALATNALMTLTALLSYDPTTGVASAIHASPLPTKILQDINDADPRNLVSSIPSSKFLAQLYQSKMDFLLNLTLAGQGQARAVSVQKMVSMQTLLKLNSCKIFDLHPEKAGLAATSLVQGVGLTRQYLHQFISPSLRVILSILSTLSQSDNVLKQGHQFLNSHMQLADRILKEAGNSSAAMGWESGREEIEEANLVVQICTILVLAGNKVPEIRLNMALHESILDLTSRMFLLNSHSRSPFICCIEDYRVGGKRDMEAERSCKALFELRSSLAAYIRTWISCEHEHLAFLKQSTANINSLLFLLKDALYQASLYDLPHVLNKIEANATHTIVQKQFAQLKRLVEHLLACMYIVMNSIRGTLDGDVDIDSLRRLCGPAIANLEQLVDKQQISDSVDSSFSVLLRKAKGQLYGF